MQTRRLSAWAVIGVLAGIVMAASGCSGSSRSALAVCKVFDTAGVAFHDHYERLARTTNSTNVLSSLAAVAGAPGRLADLMSKMDAVAPSDIEPAFKTLADTYQQMATNESGDVLHPLGGVISSLSLGLNAEGASEEVNAYVARHCGRPG
jgi:hypothetical protein